MLEAASNNVLPTGETGEAWLVFEALVRDGLEFCLGRRAFHYGGLRRGIPLTDVVAELPDRSLVVVDAKATGKAFDASVSTLRPLGEYFRRQRDRQRGQNEVVGVLVVSSRFAQDEESLKDVSLEFQVEHGGPAAFLNASTLVGMVHALSVRPDLRGALRWRSLLRGGELTETMFDAELKAADDERVGEV